MQSLAKIKTECIYLYTYKILAGTKKFLNISAIQRVQSKWFRVEGDSETYHCIVDLIARNFECEYISYTKKEQNKYNIEMSFKLYFKL